MLNIDLTGKRALVAGVADDGGFGFAIAKAMIQAGATVCVATWPPALNIFLNLLERGKMDESRKLADGSLLDFEKIYPLDAVYDTLDDAPADVRESKRYKDVGDFSITGLAARMRADFGDQPLDILVHSLANGPEVKKPLMETSRAGYLAALERERLLAGVDGAHVRPAAAARRQPSPRSPTWPASGSSPATAAACPRPRPHSRATRACSPSKPVAGTACASTRHLRRPLRVTRRQRHRHHRRDGALLRGQQRAPPGAHAVEVGHATAFLCSPLASGITGTTVYVDKGYHAMGMAVDGGTVPTPGDRE
jgi:enoyl-[acyl-carrier protein] reductase I